MDAVVRDDPDRQRYVVEVDGVIAGFAQYRVEGERIVFTHTEIDDAHEGQGLGSKLAAGALDAVRGRNLAVVPRCEFIRGWIDRHPAYADLVAS